MIFQAIFYAPEPKDGSIRLSDFHAPRPARVSKRKVFTCLIEILAPLRQATCRETDSKHTKVRSSFHCLCGKRDIPTKPLHMHSVSHDCRAVKPPLPFYPPGLITGAKKTKKRRACFLWFELHTCSACEISKVHPGNVFPCSLCAFLVCFFLGVPGRALDIVQELR